METGQFDNSLTMENALKEIIRIIEKIQGRFYANSEEFTIDAEDALTEIYDVATDTSAWNPFK